jgi:hypothetical protein
MFVSLRAVILLQSIVTANLNISVSISKGNDLIRVFVLSNITSLSARLISLPYFL